MKNNPRNVIPVLSDTRTRPLQKDIAIRARELWQRYGQPSGRDVEIWLEAERQLLGADPKITDQGSGSVSAPAFRQATGSVQPAPPSPPRH